MKQSCACGERNCFFTVTEEEEEKDKVVEKNKDDAIFCSDAAEFYLWLRKLFPSSEQGGGGGRGRGEEVEKEEEEEEEDEEEERRWRSELQCSLLYQCSRVVLVGQAIVSFQ